MNLLIFIQNDLFKCIKLAPVNGHNYDDTVYKFTYIDTILIRSTATYVFKTLSHKIQNGFNIFDKNSLSKTRIILKIRNCCKLLPQDL